MEKFQLDIWQYNAQKSCRYPDDALQYFKISCYQLYSALLLNNSASKHPCETFQADIDGNTATYVILKVGCRIKQIKAKIVFETTR